MLPSPIILVVMNPIGVPFRWMLALALWIGLGAPAQAQPEPAPIGSALPEATVERVDGTALQLAEATGSAGTVLIFWSNQCPWVDRYEGRVRALAEQFQPQGVAFILVNANDASAFPQESLQASRERAREQGYLSTYVRDRGATLARALGATRTPHVFVFDDNDGLIYTGTIDDSPSGSEGVTTSYLADALGAMVQGGEPPVARTKAFGCTIKFPNP